MFSYRLLKRDDLQAVIALWCETDGVEVAEGDALPQLERYLNRNPGGSWLVEDELGLCGACLAGHDGRRGYLYHLAVAPRARGQGVGSALVGKACAYWRQEQVARALILVAADNAQGRTFWESQGWEPLTQAGAMGLTFEPNQG